MVGERRQPPLRAYDQRSQERCLSVVIWTMENAPSEQPDENDPELAELLRLEQEQAKLEQKRKDRESGKDPGGKVRRLFGR